MAYEKPEVVDYGDLKELTADQCPGGGEDGATKEFHTTAPCG